MPVLVVVIPEEVAAENVDVLDGPEIAGESRAVLEGFKVRLRERVVVRHARPRMGLVDAEERVKTGNGITRHRGAAVGVDRLRRGSPARLDGVLDELPGEDPGFRRPRLPVDHLPRVDIDDNVKMEPYSAGRSFQLRDIPRPYLTGAVGHELGFL